jgi:hypothetical protein
MTAYMGEKLRVIDGLLLPGKVIGDGRYRLLDCAGVDERDGAQLWRARDGHLRRDVALTVLTGARTDSDAMARARETLGRAAHSISLAHPGVARLANVLSVGDGVSDEEGVLGLIVADWVAGSDLASVLAHGPVPPVVACRLLEPLAAAVAEAHHHAFVLGIGDPLRVRVGEDGGLRLAFPGPPVGSTLSDDVRGLGALLYLLVTGVWPADPGPLPTPRELHPDVPAELSEVAVHSLADTVRTADTVLQVLRKVIQDAERTKPLTPVAPPQPLTPDEDGNIWTTRRPANDPARRKKLAIGVSALIIVSLAVLVWLGTMVAGMFAADPGTGGGPPVVLDPSPSPSAPATPPNLAPHPPGPLTPSGVEIHNVSGDPDSAGKVSRAIDGNPATSWQTDSYFQQFPSFKPGIGLVVSFPQPVTLTELGITSPSAGTQVEIRAGADQSAPEIGSATLAAGTTKITVHAGAPTKQVLIWITQLGSNDRQQYQSVIDELTFTGAATPN